MQNKIQLNYNSSWNQKHVWSRYPVWQAGEHTYKTPPSIVTNSISWMIWIHLSKDFPINSIIQLRSIESLKPYEPIFCLLVGWLVRRAQSTQVPLTPQPSISEYMFSSWMKNIEKIETKVWRSHQIKSKTFFTYMRNFTANIEYICS